MVSEINDNECSARVENYTTGSVSGVHIDGLRGNLKKKKKRKEYKIKCNVERERACNCVFEIYTRDNIGS